MRIIYAGRKRIRERGIDWKEHYGEKTEPLKKRFDKKIGHGAYQRWEGHDYSTNGDYFVIVGPAVTKEGQKQFFAGIKRLPPKENRKKIYAPSGKYFTSIIGALSYANEMWGTPIDRNQVNYDVSALHGVNIPRHIKGSQNKEYKYGNKQ